MTLKMRLGIERAIVYRVVREALNAGLYLSVDNGGDELEIKLSRNEKDIRAAMLATDDERLILHRRDEEGKARRVGMIFFVYGNDGWDVICDYSVALEAQPWWPVIDQMTERYCELFG